MLKTALSTISENVAVGWVRRRAIEVGGILGMAVPFVMAMPPEQQAVLVAILTGQGGGLTVMALLGFAAYAFGQWRSWRATVKPQVVTPDKRRRELTNAEALAMNNAETGLNQTHIPTR